MTEALHVAAGGLLALAGWLIPRRVAKTRIAASLALLLDFLPIVLTASLLLIATGRPLFTGVLLFSLGTGFALADRTKREVLREPVVFSDMSEFPHVFTYPQLYLPFAGPVLVVGGAVAALALSLALFWFEPELWEPDPLLVLPAFLLVGAGVRLISREPALGAAALALRRLGATGEPLKDAAKLGPFATILTYGLIARAERVHRRARHAPHPAPLLSRPHTDVDVPVILVQCESFFDARRLSPLIPRDLLSGFDACCESGATFGRFEVSGWGANTMRAEFAALTGIAEAELGYDRFNPYHAFARAPTNSLVWRMRDRGYRTICLHPFDRGFFRRDLTLPALGFETFLGLESLGGSRRPPYTPDPELANQVLEVLAAQGPRVFIFVITMGNHGPWREVASKDPALKRQFDPTGLPQGAELLSYLEGLRQSDAMLQILASGLQEEYTEAILAFYGDHLPSLPRAFRYFGFDEWHSDYVMWHNSSLPAGQLDLPAHRLPRLIIDALHATGAIDMPGARAPVSTLYPDLWSETLGPAKTIRPFGA
ncbi:MAG: LTA synthase family protein [Stellaceae bacterium]